MLVRFGARHLNQVVAFVRRAKDPVTKGVLVEMLAATGTLAEPTCKSVVTVGGPHPR